MEVDHVAALEDFLKTDLWTALVNSSVAEIHLTFGGTIPKPSEDSSPSVVDDLRLHTPPPASRTSASIDILPTI